MKQNTIRITIRPVLAGLFTVTLFAGCVKRDLEERPTVPPEGSGRAEITLDWNGDERPQTARFLFYDSNTGTLVKEVTGLTDGFAGELPAGEYRLVVHNTDALQVDYRGTDNYETAEVFAQETEYTHSIQTSITAAGLGHNTDAAGVGHSGFYGVEQYDAVRSGLTRHDPGVPCILEPQVAFGTGAFNESETIVVTPDATVKASVSATLLTKQMEFHFTVKSDVGVTSLKGVLTGIAPGMFIASQQHNAPTACAIEFTAMPETKAVTRNFLSRLSVFGLLTTPQSPDETNVINVVLTLDDGKVFQAKVDLTPTLKEIIADNGGTIPIEIPVDVTLEINGIEGLTATVKPWEEGTGGGDFE